MNNTATKTEIVVTFHGQNGTWRTAYLSPSAAVTGMRDQLKIEGTVVASVCERTRETYSEERFPELTK